MCCDDKILLGHGSGGTMMSKLISDEFLSTYMDNNLYLGDDSTLLSNVNLKSDEQIVMSTDSYVVSPSFFPGGDVGKLAVCGTVNDISTSGAKPVALSVSFILEEGFLISQLKKICKSIALAAKEADVSIVTGDTKVVDQGKCDGIYINTSGIGIVKKNNALSCNNIKSDDIVLISGSIGDHGICIMSQREGIKFDTEIKSDTAPLNKLIDDVLKAAPNTRCFRDPTRGGVSSTLNELAKQSFVDITINEVEVPIKKAVDSACQMFGYDPFHVANEGKMICIVPPNEADFALNAMRSNKYGKESAIIGYAEEQKQSIPRVFLQTRYKSKRILDMLVGDQLPRIC